MESIIIIYMIRAEVNLRTIRANIKTLQRQLAAGIKICAVVKSNAYSLGDTVIAPYIQRFVDWFAVASIREGSRLRKCGITKPILLLGVCEDFAAAVALNLTISVCSLNEMKGLVKTLGENEKASVHVKVNTGMNRFGITSLWQLRSILNYSILYPNIKVDGLYTHMAYESDNPAELDKSIEKFRPYVKVVKNTNPCAIVHAASSGSAGYSPACFDMVRVGKLLYGGLDNFRTVIKCTSTITAIQTLPKGAKVGYGGTEALKQGGIIGVVPCGYADLAHFNFAHGASVGVGGQSCLVVGRVCMDSFMINVTNVESPLGKTVTIMSESRGRTIMDIARASGTIACELLCNLNFQRANLKYKK